MSVAIGDVNGDGKLDLLVANECASITGGECIGAAVSVLLGNGDGTFQVPVSYSLGEDSSAHSVAAGDVNGDGKLDLVVVTNSLVAVLLGNGDGTFQQPLSYGLGGYFALAVVVADVNGDGRPDLLVANLCADSSCYTNGSVGVLLGNGDGTFQAAQTYDAGDYYANSLAVADVNGDGKFDVLVSTSESVGVLLGNGDGTFQPASAYGQGGINANSVAIADVNRDGKPDLLVANECVSTSRCSNGSVNVLLGNGDGTFQADLSYESAVGSSPVPSVVTADLNGDGNVDVLVTNECDSYKGCPNGSVQVLLGRGDGKFQLPVSYSSGGSNAFSAAVGDVNGDGKPDIVVTNQCDSVGDCTNGVVSVLLGNGDGTFRSPVSYSLGESGGYFVALGDVNGDGKLDIAVGTSSAVTVLLGNGDGTFQPAVSYSSGGYSALSVALADVNGDGRLDLLVANECANATGCTNGVVAVLLGNGDGTFQPATAIDSGGSDSFYLAVGDVNGDGKLDLVVANTCADSSCQQGGSVSVLLGNGDGTFQTAVPIATPGRNSGAAIVLADFNGDGKLDVASGRGDLLLLGNGDGTFQSPLELGAVGFGIAVGDFNRNGRPDLAISDDTRVAILPNVAPNFHYETTTTLTSSQNPSPSGKAVIFNAIVSSAAGVPGGKVTFIHGSTILATKMLAGGAASYATQALPAGLNNVTAVYGGDSNHLRSASTPISQLVLATTKTVLTSSPNPSVTGQTVVFASTVTSSIDTPPDGEIISFKQGTTVLGIGTLSGGAATFSTTALGVGTKGVTAVYAGDADFATSTSKAVSQVVSKATSTTTLTSSQNPSTYGQPVTFTATVAPQFSGTPTGSVVFKDGAKTIEDSDAKRRHGQLYDLDAG